MYGAPSTRFLFNIPLSILHHRPATILRLHHRHSLTGPLRLLSAVANSKFTIKFSQQVNSQSTSNTLHEENHNHVPAVPPSHPWPEMSNLIESIFKSGYFDMSRNMKDEFVPNESLPMEFVDAACSCLGFAHDRSDILGWLSKDDIQVLIDGGAPFLFKNALETERRMRSFLQGEGSNDVTTVDLMKYILNYASSPIIYPERNIREAAESSARNLLREMANFSSRGAAFCLPDMEKFNGAVREGGDEQTPRNLEPSNKMKRGDWICPECSFVNFAKDTECVECMELRPRRQLTGYEWDCPQCNFYNHGRNVACLKCECGRPGEVPLLIGQPTTSQNHNNFSNNCTANGNENDQGRNKNLEQIRSNTTSGSNSGKDGRFPTRKGSNSGYAPFVPLPADMFAKKSENVKPKTTGSGGDSGNSATKVESGIKDSSKDEDFPDIMPMRKGEIRFVVSKKKDRSLTSPKLQRKQAMEQESSSSKFVPFVPFPPDYFAKKDENQDFLNSRSDNGGGGSSVNQAVSSSSTQMKDENQDFLNSRSSVDNGGGGSGGNQAVISPSTQMKNENQDFLNSRSDNGGGSSGNQAVSSSITQMKNENQDFLNSRSVDNGGGGSSGNQAVNSPSTQMKNENQDFLNSQSSVDNGGGGSSGNRAVNSSSTQMKDENQDFLNSRASVDNGGESSGIKTGNSSSTQMNGSEIIDETSYGGWKMSETEKVRKSLEGSAVKETNPLDMSEEAKAERWFRRVAQIKDISELSQIPDEDFPSIMPMRKGMNRFVVSKRKTPLERRLTSPEYRKNLGTVGLDPTEKEGDDN